MCVVDIRLIRIINTHASQNGRTKTIAFDEKSQAITQPQPDTHKSLLHCGELEIVANDIKNRVTEINYCCKHTARSLFSLRN